MIDLLAYASNFTVCISISRPIGRKWSARIHRAAIAALSVILFFTFANSVPAMDVVRLIRPHSALDHRHVYNNAMLSAALEKTVAVYGDYEIKLTLAGTQRKRALLEMISGRHINVHIVPTQNEWERKTIPIRIPIAKGVLGYRLFLIKHQDLDRFSSIHTIDQLKACKAGLRQQWSTTKALQAQGFHVVTGSSYEGLFHMLVKDRFDYFPRGVNEIFPEFAQRKDGLPEMIIEPTKALYLPMPTYIFVSPALPELAQRIETGLQEMIQDGSFDSLFWEHHKNSVQQANLAGRMLFTVNNPLLPPGTPLDQKHLWVDLIDSRNQVAKTGSMDRPAK